jgi:plastocyanin
VRRAALIALLLVSTGQNLTGATAAAKPKVHTVTIEGMAFSPRVVTAAPGDTIVWVNKDFVPHTATTSSPSFDSKSIGAGKSWRYTIRQKGEIPYICTFHPRMKGVVRVL